MKKYFALAAVFAVTLMASVCFAGVVEVTDATFYDQVVRTYDPVVVEFSAPWCHYCTKMAGTVDSLAKEYAGKVKFVKVDFDKNPDTVKKYNVRGIPAFFYLKGGYVQGSAVGAMSKEELKKQLGLK